MMTKICANLNCNNIIKEEESLQNSIKKFCDYECSNEFHAYVAREVNKRTERSRKIHRTKIYKELGFNKE